MALVTLILDDGYNRKTIVMDKPNKGLYIKGNIWREFTNFSLHCVVMVLANFPFDPKDYIRDYQLFLREVRNDSSLV